MPYSDIRSWMVLPLSARISAAVSLGLRLCFLRVKVPDVDLIRCHVRTSPLDCIDVRWRFSGDFLLKIQLRWTLPHICLEEPQITLGPSRRATYPTLCLLVSFPCFSSSPINLLSSLGFCLFPHKLPFLQMNWLNWCLAMLSNCT